MLFSCALVSIFHSDKKDEKLIKKLIKHSALSLLSSQSVGGLFYVYFAIQSLINGTVIYTPNKDFQK